MTISGGWENDRLLEQGPIPVLVPGGYFVDVRPGVLFSRSIAERTRLNLDAVASFERFANDET